MVLEMEKDSDSVLRFERVRNGDGIVEDIVGPFCRWPSNKSIGALSSHAALQQSSCKELIL